MNKLYRGIRKIAREATLRWRKPGRYVIERKIFPKLKNKKILLVGVAHYTSQYPKKLKNNNNKVWTIDIDKDVARYGSKNHVIGSIVDADKHFNKNFFDIILMIGVFGYGLNDKKQGEKALNKISKILKQNGLLIIQWADLSPYNIINPVNLKNSKLYKRINCFGYKSGYKTKRDMVFEFWKNEKT